MFSLVSIRTPLILLLFQLSSIIFLANIPEIKAQNPKVNLWVYVISRQVWLTLFITAGSLLKERTCICYTHLMRWGRWRSGVGIKRDAEKLEKLERSIQSQERWFKLDRNLRFAYLTSKACLIYMGRRQISAVPYGDVCLLLSICSQNENKGSYLGNLLLLWWLFCMGRSSSIMIQVGKRLRLCRVLFKIGCIRANMIE